MLPLETLNRVEQLVNADALRPAILDAIKNAPALSDIVPTVVLPDGKVINCEPYDSARTRARGEFSTHSIGAFAGFLGDTGTRAPVAVDVAKMTASAILDHGELSSVVNGSHRQGHCGLKAHIALRKSAAWEAVTKVAGPAAAKPHRFDQQSLAEWLIDQSHVIAGASWEVVDSGASFTLPTKSAISRILSVKVKAEGERTDTVSPLAREAAARESLRIEGTDAAFPTGFALMLPPYIGLQQRSIQLRLNVYVQKSEPPAFSLAIVGYDNLVEQLGIEFDEALRAAIKPGRADILIGNYAA